MVGRSVRAALYAGSTAMTLWSRFGGGSAGLRTRSTWNGSSLSSIGGSASSVEYIGGAARGAGWVKYTSPNRLRYSPAGEPGAPATGVEERASNGTRMTRMKDRIEE